MKLVLFINMGGAENLKDCKTFLTNMFNDPFMLNIKGPMFRSFVAWMITKYRVKTMQKNYESLNGKSPLNGITRDLCSKLNSSQQDFTFDFVNMYVPPFAKDVLLRYDFNQFEEVILFPLYPHSSFVTVDSSIYHFAKTYTELAIKNTLKIVPVFYQNDTYNKMIVKHILSHKAEYEKNNLESKGMTLIFSSHSVPVSMIKRGDLYQKHTEAHFEDLKRQLSPYFKDVLLSYQSRLGPIEWLGPNTLEVANGIEGDIIIYPISFCIDCSETIFELDIEYREEISNNLVVVKCPNDTPEFIDFILETVSNLGDDAIYNSPK